MTKALYLSGGGARGAYQVGVLKGMQEIMQFSSKLPVEILSGVSAGSINGAMLAMHADNFAFGVKKLEQLWQGLECKDVFKDSNWAILKSVTRHILSFIFGHAAKGYLFDTSPLRQLLLEHVDFFRMHQMIIGEYLQAFEVAANCYDLSETVSFFNSKNPYVSWRRVRHISYRCELNVDHIMASSAIPLFFPAVKIGVLHYGDGTMRLSTPLRGAIKLGATHILIIGTRSKAAPHELINSASKTDVTLGKVLGSMMNALFLDNLDRDLEMLNNLNQRLKSGKITSSHWRYLNTLHISPSLDLGSYAKDYEKNVAVLLRFLMKALGSPEQSSDFLSFLLFDGEYANKLIEIGYQDALDNAESIQEFFNPSN
jgi:NTE family protein